MYWVIQCLRFKKSTFMLIFLVPWTFCYTLYVPLVTLLFSNIQIQSYLCLYNFYFHSTFKWMSVLFVLIRVSDWVSEWVMSFQGHNITKKGQIQEGNRSWGLQLFPELKSNTVSPTGRPYPFATEDVYWVCRGVSSPAQDYPLHIILYYSCVLCM